MSSTELVSTGTLADRVEYAKTLAPADLLPPAFKGKPANILLAMDMAESLGRSPIEIMQQSQVISGKLGLSAEFMRSLVLASGHTFRVFMDGDTAVAQGVRKDDREFTYEARWDMARAKVAGLGTGNNWKAHPTAMLKARATTELCRDVFADVIHGFRSVDELQEISANQPVSQSKPADSLRAAVDLPPADDDVVDAELVDDLITEQQSKLMFKLFHDKGFADRTGRLDYCMGLIRRDIETSKDLTRDEASSVINSLQSEPEPDGESNEAV